MLLVAVVVVALLGKTLLATMGLGAPAAPAGKAAPAAPGDGSTDPATPRLDASDPAAPAAGIAWPSASPLERARGVETVIEERSRPRAEP